MIMICGETGTGKEMLAQAIHNYSQRRQHPFVAVNCAAIPESLQESTLFGTSRGAFTGALERQGLFEEATGGTLYLDEVDSMPLALQAKLLRVLQDKKVRRVGSSMEKAVDVRILSSVKKEYRQALPLDTFRKDFYFRLSVVLIEIPPLRIRSGDLELLTNHFIAKNNLLLGMQVESVSAEVMELFRHYEWPGNVRELEHVIEGAMNAVGRSAELQMEHLPSNFAVSRSPAQGSVSGDEVYPFFPLGDRDRLLQGLERLKAPDSDAAFEGKVNLTKSQNRREAEMLHQAIKEAEGNISEAARQLGVSRQLLHYKLKKLGIIPKKLKK
jgi:arginine utilization regulatory protein